MGYGPLKLGAMIEIPAAALTLKLFLKYFDFLSIGTNDLIQYTLAIDRADESVAHLYDPLHPAVLRLVADTIAECNQCSKPTSQPASWHADKFRWDRSPAPPRRLVRKNHQPGCRQVDKGQR